jgi:hypothetical protein
MSTCQGVAKINSTFYTPLKLRMEKYRYKYFYIESESYKS